MKAKQQSLFIESFQLTLKFYSFLPPNFYCLILKQSIFSAAMNTIKKKKSSAFGCVLSITLQLIFKVARK